MIGYLLTLSVLIAVVLLIRAVFRRTVSPRVIYALWLVVVIRMLVPITLFNIEVTIPKFLRIEQTEQVPDDSHGAVDVQFPIQSTPPTPSLDIEQTIPDFPPVVAPPTPLTPIIPNETQATEIIPPEIDPSDIIPLETTPIEVTVPADPTTDVTKATTSVNWKQIADLVWFSGALITAAWFSLTSFTYTKNLHKDRKLHKTFNGTKVYISGSADVPCIAGIIPAIYITPEAANSKSEELIIAHEYTHLRHKDHIWSFIRVLAIVVFWYNPLVWIAAFVSKQDAELACDYAVSSKLSYNDKLEYANILINTIPQSHRYAVGLGSAPIKKRILMLTKKQKNRIACLVLAVALAITAVGCSFASLNEKEQEQTPADTDPADTDPVDTEPIDTEPIDTEPIDTEPVDTDPIDTEPIDTDPVNTEPIDTEPVDTDPVDTDPIDTEPIDTDPEEDPTENVISFTSPNGRYSIKFYKITATIYPESGMFFHPCDRVSLIDNQTGKEIVTDNKGYMFPSPDITWMWSSDSKYCAIVVGDSRYTSSPLFFDTSRGKIFGFDLHTIDVAQVIENESQRPVKSVLYSIHERVVEFSGDTAKMRANMKVGSADDDKYVIAEYVYSLSNQKISELTYTFSDNYYPTAEETVTASLDKIMEGYGKYSTLKELVEAYPAECSAIVALGNDGADCLCLEVVKYDTATSDMERTRCLVARYISDMIVPRRYSVLTVGKKYKIIARATQIIGSADESPDYTDISFCYADSDDPLLTLNGPFYDGHFYWSKDGNYVIIAAGKDIREASLIIGQNRQHIVLPKDEIFTQAATSFGENAKLLSISTDYGVWKPDSLVAVKYDMSVRDGGKTYRVYGTYTYNIPKRKIEQITFNGLPNGVTHATFVSTSKCTPITPIASDRIRQTINENLDILVSVNRDKGGRIIDTSFKQDDYISANKEAFDAIIALGEAAFEDLKQIGDQAFTHSLDSSAMARCILARVALHKIRPSFYDCVLPVPVELNRSDTSEYSLAFTAVDLFDLAAPHGERSIGYKVSLLKNGKVVCTADKELGYTSNPIAAGNILFRWTERYVMILSYYKGEYSQVDFFDLENGEFVDYPDIENGVIICKDGVSSNMKPSEIYGLTVSEVISSEYIENMKLQIIEFINDNGEYCTLYISTAMPNSPGLINLVVNP